MQEIDPNFVPMASTAQATDAASTDTQKRPLTAEDFRIPLGVERVRCPEILMQPTMVGIDQVGVGEMVGASLRRLPEDYYEAVVEGTILLTGGSSLFEGLDVRLTSELRSQRPYGSTISAVRASDPLLDAWRGASFFAASQAFDKCVITKEDYEGKGPDWLRSYKLQYSLSLP
jgi:actin-related protein 5